MKKGNLTSHFPVMSHGLIHANNVLSTTLYYYLNFYVRTYFDIYYNVSSSESHMFPSAQPKYKTNSKQKKLQMLLRVVWSINDRQFEKALQLLSEVEKEFHLSSTQKDFIFSGTDEEDDIIFMLRKFITEGIFSENSISQ
jgi:hypothetical protein